MAKQDEVIIREIGNVYYAEPNDIGGGAGNVPVPLEDLCMYVELRVEYGTTITERNGKNSITLVYKVDNGTPFVSLYSGINDGNGSYLSTEGYGNYTLDRVQNEGTEELFGVESIDIAYNSFAVPEVTIKFSDVKGAALHAAEELTHDENGGQIEDNKIPLTAKFLNCFFTVPYPRFTLLVKGFYGEPVHYDLTCADFRSTFVSKTGNYDVTAKLVGYSYALVSDVTMCSLLAAPLTHFHGKSYWEDETTNGSFKIDGQPMPTLKDIIKTWKDISSNIKPLDNDEEQKTKQEKFLYQGQAITCWYEFLAGLQSDDKTKGYVEYDTETKKVKVKTARGSFISFTDLLRKSDHYNALQNKLRTIEEHGVETYLELCNGENFYYLKDKDTYTYKVKQELEKLEQFNNGPINFEYIGYFDFQFFIFDRLEQNLMKMRSGVEAEMNRREHIINERIKEELNFTPTIENITKICFAHLETLLYMFKMIKDDGSEGHFPKIVDKKINSQGTTQNIELWPGDFGMVTPEVEFVQGIVDGTKNLAIESSLFTNGNLVTHDSYAHPYDLLYPPHHYTKNFKNGFNETAFLQRVYNIVCETCIKSPSGDTFNEKLVKAIAEQDARHYYDEQPNGYPRIAEDILALKFQLASKKKNPKKYLLKLYNFNFYDISDSTIRGKKIVQGEGNNNTKTVELIADDGWASPNFDFNTYVKPNVALLQKRVGSMTEDDTSSLLYELYAHPKQSYFIPTSGDTTVSGGSNNNYSYNVYSAKKESNSNNDSILTIPSFDLIGSSNQDDYDKNWVLKSDIEKHVLSSTPAVGRTLFTEIWYQNADKYTKAALFLCTFQWKVNWYSAFSSLNTKSIRAVPYYYILLIGAAAYNFSRQTPMYVEQKMNQTIAGMGGLPQVTIRNYLPLYNGNIAKAMKKLQEKGYVGYLDKFKKEFEGWVENYYIKWDGAIKKDEDLIKTNLAHMKKDDGRQTYVFSGGSKLDVYANMFSTLPQSDSKDDVINRTDHADLRFFRTNSKTVQQMTEQLFELRWLVTYGNGKLNIKADDYETEYRLMAEEYKKANNIIGKNVIYKDKRWARYYINEEVWGKCAELYCKTFQEEIGRLFTSKTEKMIHQYLGDVTTSRSFVDLNIYRYLKQIWDRWILAGNDYNSWRMQDVLSGNKKRIHFIDAAYNDIGQLLEVNIDKFVELLINCMQQEDLPFLSFLSYFYGDNNCVLNNVQNFINAQKKEYLKKIFQPIPIYEVNFDETKKYSDLVVLFSYQAAENHNDSFDINIDDDEKFPSSMRNKYNVSYKVPAFGVAYGMQNQNYFTDINVAMTTPNVTDQSIQATLQIADENYGGSATDNETKIRTVGQDLYRVYSNHAYQCDVTMMGCAWMQPLMYFQLTNVPLFRGAYIIHKVIHSIGPNTMTTKFTGTKVSNISIRQLENCFYSNDKAIAVGSFGITERKMVNVDNNCSYKAFIPYVSDDKNRQYINNALHHFKQKHSEYSGLTYGQYYATRLYLPSETITGLYKFLCIFLHNRYYREWETNLNDDLMCHFFEGIFEAYHNVFGNHNNIVDYYSEKQTEIDGVLEYLILCFSDTETCIRTHINKNDWFNRNLESVDDCEPHTQNSELPHNTCILWCGDDWTYDEFRKTMKGVVFLHSKYGSKGHYFTKKSHEETDKLTIEKLVETFNKTLAETPVLSGVKLVLAKDQNGNDMLFDGKEAYITTDIGVDDAIKAQVFDMILQTYSQYVSKLQWVLRDNSKQMWEYIRIDIGNEGFSVSVSTLSNTNNKVSTNVAQTHESLHSNFYMSLIKKYSITKISNQFANIDDKFKTECKNFASLTKNDNWKELVLNFLNTDSATKGIEIKDCAKVIDDALESARQASGLNYDSDYDPSFVPETRGNQSFEGNGQENGPPSNPNQLQIKITENDMKMASQTTSISDDGEDDIELMLLRNGFKAVNNDITVTNMQCVLAQTAQKQALDNEAHNLAIEKGGKTGDKIKSQCARYVRLAIENGVGLKILPNNPISACRYWRYLEYWGFTRIYHGMTTEYTGGYQDGDIIVTAGVTNQGDGMKHGHIQVYYNGKWYADKSFQNPNVYSKHGDRLCFIYRILRRERKPSSSATAIVHIANYVPSDEIIEAIKYFEGFLPLWWKFEHENGYTIGHGFFETPDLKSKFPYDKNPSLICKDGQYNEINGKESSIEGSMTFAYADSYMRKTTIPGILEPFKETLKFVGQNYTQAQLDALFSLTYNVGYGNLRDKSPKLMQALREKNLQKAADNMDHGMQQGLEGLKKRRKWEQSVFLTNTYPPYPK